jgi:hypothetical protein
MYVYVQIAKNVNLPIIIQQLQTDVNSVPRSLIIVLHTPCFVNICARPEDTVIVSLLAKGIEIKYLLGISTAVRA